MEGLQRMMRMMMMKISNYVNLHKYMLGGGWKGQDLQGLLWWIIIEGQGEVKGGGVDFEVINSLLGEILGEVMGEME
ncbi:hypothetical protein Tco_0295728 [Tanacetum coccineum]